MTSRCVSTAWLALLLSACGGKAVVDEPAGTLAGADCVAACAAQFPAGAEEFRKIGSSCLCDGCDDACTESVCHELQLPTDACLPCVQAGYLGDHCQNHEAFFSDCTTESIYGNNECYPFAMCLVACPVTG